MRALGWVTLSCERKGWEESTASGQQSWSRASIKA